MSGKRLRFGYGALAMALIALSLLLVQPVCAASEDHAFSHVCCVVPDDIASSSTPTAQPLPDLKALPAIAWHIAPRLSLAVASPILGASPPGAAPARQLAYHARSARNLS